MFFYLSQICEQSLLMFPLVLGIYVSFSILKIADLSVDGSLVLGASVFAKLNISGVPFGLAILAATLAGFAAGIVCALVQYNNRIDPLIAGILMAFILHSLSLIIMQRPNIGLLATTNIFNYAENLLKLPTSINRLIILIIIGSILYISLSLFLVSFLGLWLKAFGNSQTLVAMLGQNPERLRLTGLALGNGLAALSGCLIAQAAGYADINMGFGQALIGIAMVLIGRELLHFFSRSQGQQKNDYLSLFFSFVGIFIYFFLTNELIRYGLSPIYLKMAIGILLIVFLSMASRRAHNPGI